MTQTFHKANFIERCILRTLGFGAICWPWRRIAIMPQWIDHKALRAHELVHLEQIDRHGPFVFTALYLWYTAIYGYRKNPFEVEAYRRATP